MVVIIRHKYATAHSKAAYLRQIGAITIERTLATGDPNFNIDGYNIYDSKSEEARIFEITKKSYDGIFQSNDLIAIAEWRALQTMHNLIYGSKRPTGSLYDLLNPNGISPSNLMQLENKNISSLNYIIWQTTQNKISYIPK